MKDDPILARKSIEDGKMSFTVYGGLHYISANAKPYFSLTYWQRGVKGEEGGGAGHDTILKHFPQFADLAALHLSDIDGVPSYVEANGWYDLAGYFGGAGERYHAGNSSRRDSTVRDDPGETREHCLRLWAEHVRLPLDKAKESADMIETKWNYPDMRKSHAEFIEAQKPRWKQEADACIAKHSLVVYGDKWPRDE